MHFVWATGANAERTVSISDSTGALIRGQTVRSLEVLNNNFTSFSLPANTHYRFSSPLHQGLTKLNIKFGSTESASDYLRFTIDDLPSVPAVGASPAPLPGGCSRKMPRGALWLQWTAAQAAGCAIISKRR